MRVLHLYSGNLVGGVETFLLTLARNRRLCPSLEQHFALCFEGQCSSDLQATGVPLYTLGAVRASRPVTILKARSRLRDLLDRQPYDAVICHACWSHAMFAPVVQAAGIPLVFWQHDVLTGRHWLERWASLSQPDLAFCNSVFSRKSLSTVFPEARTKVTYCPVTSTPGEPHGVRKQLDTKEDTTVIIQVSRIEEYKGHKLHLEVLGGLRHVPGWVLWLVGGPQRPHEARYYEDLKVMAREAGISDRVRFLGWRSDVADLLASADIHCQPNTGPEPFGISFIEAMQASLPVVTTALGAAREIVDETCGIITPPGDAGALRTALCSLIEDPARRRWLGSNGPARARLLCDAETQLKLIQSSLATLTKDRKYGSEPVNVHC